MCTAATYKTRDFYMGRTPVSYTHLKTKKQVIQKGLADMCMLQVPFRLPESYCCKIIKKITRKFC